MKYGSPDEPDLPPEVLRHCEDAYAEANEFLASVLESVRRTVSWRLETLGMQDDSVHYCMVRDWLTQQIVMQGDAQKVAVVLSAALFKLIHVPLEAIDPLARLDEEMEQRNDDQ